MRVTKTEVTGSVPVTAKAQRKQRCYGITVFRRENIPLYVDRWFSIWGCASGNTVTDRYTTTTNLLKIYNIIGGFGCYQGPLRPVTLVTPSSGAFA